MAVAVLIDATIVRGVLLPAGLALLGDRAFGSRGPRGRRGARHAEVTPGAGAQVIEGVTVR
jgi:RND superfamily putative drug exporter